MPADIVNGSLTPVEAGDQMSVTLNDTLFDEMQKYYIAIRAYDDTSKASDISNVAQLFRAGDIFPPSAVGDLNITLLDDDTSFNLSFTASGDNYDVGKGKHQQEMIYAFYGTLYMYSLFSACIGDNNNGIVKN
jgi:hypothetical protein